MKKWILGILMFCSMTAFAAEPATQKAIKFEGDNYFAVTSEFGPELLDNFAEKVYSYDKDTMLLYVYSPGGSVISLARMASIMKSSKIKFVCVAQFAASAAFMLFEHCNERYVTSDGILMSHNWSGGFQDEAPRILTLFNAVQSLVDTMENEVTKKMKISLTDYRKEINNNWWMFAEMAKTNKAVDGVTNNVTCSEELLKKRVAFSTIQCSFFGCNVVQGYKSGCPLIQKVYQKVKKGDADEDIFEVRPGTSLFEQAQKSYKLEAANWIYLGKIPNK